MPATATPLADLHAHRYEIPDTYEVDRPCAVPNCITVLSIYNPGPTCWACGGKAENAIDTKPLAESLIEVMEQR